MASVNFVPYQDPENVSLPEAEKMHTKRRVQAKSFTQDNIAYATPRRALGDVKNLRLHQSGSAVKTTQQHQSARKPRAVNKLNLNLESSSLNSTNLPKPPKSAFSVKKDQKQEFKVYQEPVVKEDKHLVHEEKEIMHPLKEEELGFELPEYLSTVLNGNAKTSLWWPLLEETPVRKSSDVDCDLDFSNLKLDDLPSHDEDIQEQYLKEIGNLESEIFQDLHQETDNDLFLLQELEKDLEDIDTFCQF
eukprot:gene9485-10475_t